MASQKDKLIAEALKLVEKGQYERAVKIYLKVVEEDASDVRIWLKIGDLYTKLRRNSEAADTYQHVAQAYSEQGFYTKAIAVYKQILKLDPSLVTVHERLADLYKQMGLLPDAIEQYTLVAQHHQREGHTREALGPLKQIVDLEPHNIPSRVKLAELYSREQMVREAIDEFAKAAESLHEQGRFDDYMKVAERLLFHSPDNRPVSRELARLYLARGEARRALPRLQVCFKADPRDGDTLKLLGEAFQALGQTVKAVSVLKELARIHAENGNAGERARTWRRVLELDPTDTEAQGAAREESQSRARPESHSSLRGVAQSVIVTDSVVASSPFDAPPAARGPASSPRIAVPGLPGASGPSSSPSLGPPMRSPQPLQTSRLDEVDTSSTIRSMPAFDLMLAAAAQGKRADQPPALLDEKEIAKILAETDVFTKYNLHAKAIEHVRTVFERNPEHVAAREKLAALLVLTGKPAEALEELRALAEQAEGTGAEARYLDEMLALSPAHGWAEERRAALRAGLSSRSAAAPHGLPSHVEVELDDSELTEEPEEEPAAPYASTRAMAASAGDPSQDDLEEDDEIDLGVVHVDDAFDSAPEPLHAGDEFAVVVEDGPAESEAAAAPLDIEDRFGADLDEDELEEREFLASAPPLSQLPVHDELAPELDPRSALASEEVVEPPPQQPAYVPPPEAVDNFDFSSFDDPSASSPSLQVEIEPIAAIADDEAPIGLPSLEQPEAELVAAPPPFEPSAPAMAGSLGDEDDEITGDVIMPAPAEQLGGSNADDASLEDELEEADFYLAQGMTDEAREALEVLLAAHPGHPLVLAKLSELEPPAEAPAPPASEATVAVHMDDLLGEPPAASDDAAAARGPRETTTVTGVTRQIVEAAVNDDDFESHFDLGIGCKEMGLYDQAISEFKQAMRDPAREVQCQQMIGLCFLAKGQTHEAVRHFKQGLYAEGIREDEELSLYYELGQAYERLGDRAEALYYFERIRKRKARYRDIERRLEALEGAADGAVPPAALQRK